MTFKFDERHHMRTSNIGRHDSDIKRILQDRVNALEVEKTMSVKDKIQRYCINIIENSLAGLLNSRNAFV